MAATGGAQMRMTPAISLVLALATERASSMSSRMGRSRGSHGPAHVGNFFSFYGLKPSCLLGNDIQAGRVVLLTVPAEELHPQADPKYRLGQAFDQLIQPGFAKVRHGRAGFSYSWKNHLIRPAYGLSLIHISEPTRPY